MLGGSALTVAAMNDLNAAVYNSLKSLNRQFQKSPDGVYWDAVRKYYLLENNLIMMNNGTLGPMPEPVFNTLMTNFEVQLKCPVDCYTYLSSLKEHTREKVARFINASPDEIALVRNTTEGMNFFANGLDMKPGDEVIITDMEHPAGIHPWRLKEKRYGIKVKVAQLNFPLNSVEEIIDNLKKEITSKTKVISVSHTVFITGLIAPLKEISEFAHKKDILVLADSAHGLGMLNLDMKELGIDGWCTSPYKWFGAPPEAGVFYVRKEIQDRLWPSTATSGWDTRKSARKFETFSQRADPLLIALGEAVEFHNHIGKQRVARRVQTLGNYLRENLVNIPGAKLHLKNDPYLASGLTAFSVKNVNAGYMVDYLREKYNIVIRTVGNEEKGTRGVRVSTNIYVSMKDIDKLLEGVEYLAKNA